MGLVVKMRHLYSHPHMKMHFPLKKYQSSRVILYVTANCYITLPFQFALSSCYHCLLRPKVAVYCHFIKMFSQTHPTETYNKLQYIQLFKLPTKQLIVPKLVHSKRKNPTKSYIWAELDFYASGST